VIRPYIEAKAGKFHGSLDSKHTSQDDVEILQNVRVSVGHIVKLQQKTHLILLIIVRNHFLVDHRR